MQGTCFVTRSAYNSNWGGSARETMARDCEAIHSVTLLLTTKSLNFSQSFSSKDFDLKSSAGICLLDPLFLKLHPRKRNVFFCFPSYFASSKFNRNAQHPVHRVKLSKSHSPLHTKVTVKVYFTEAYRCFIRFSLPSNRCAGNRNVAHCFSELARVLEIRTACGVTGDANR